MFSYIRDRLSSPGFQRAIKAYKGFAVILIVLAAAYYTLEYFGGRQERRG